MTPARVFELPAEPANIEDQPLEDRAAFASELRKLAAFLNERADELDGDVLLTVQECAALAGRSDEAIRVWVREHGIGQLDPVAGRYLIRRSRLIEHILTTQGVLPAGLRNLSLPKAKSA